jgi:hypothetical protein
MERDTVVRLARPGASVADDPLLLVLRDGARRMLQQVIEAEIEAFLGAHAELEDAHGRRRVVRNGHAPEREIQTGIGPISVRRPKLRDRGDGADGKRIRFTSKVLPPFLRRTRNIEELLPWLYLKGVSTGQFEEALTALLGPDAPGLSASTVRRLVAAWQEEHERWQRRDLSGRRFVYIWADGVYFTPRLDHDRQCLLVVIGADADGKKALLAIEDGFRESAQSWRELLLRLRDENGLKVDPELATGDGGLGFWKALHEIWPKTRQQRCPPGPAGRVPSRDRMKGLLAFHGFIRRPMFSTSCRRRCKARRRKICTRSTRPKTGKPLKKLSIASSRNTARSTTRRRTAWSRIAQHCSLSTTSRPNTGSTCVPRIPSRARSRRCGCGPTKPRDACHARRHSPLQGLLALSPPEIGAKASWPLRVFKLAKSAERHWRKLDGANRLGQLIEGVKFRNGEPVQEAGEKAAA